MKVILLEGDEAYKHLLNDMKKLVKLAVKEVKDEEKKIAGTKDHDVWVNTEEAKKILGIKGKNKMQEIRDGSPGNGVVISQHGRTFLYRKDSLLNYLNKHIIE